MKIMDGTEGSVVVILSKREAWDLIEALTGCVQGLVQTPSQDLRLTAAGIRNELENFLYRAEEDKEGGYFDESK